MSAGFNSNVRVGEVVYHVQTEQRGADGGVIDTVVYISGRVIHRLKTKLSDGAEAPNASHDAAHPESRDGAERDDAALSANQRVERQHKNIIAQLESGALPPPASAEPGGAK
jgi:hypothetical protein